MSPLVEPDGTDVLADVLYSLQLRGHIFCRCEFGAPWSFGVTPDGFGHFHLIEQGTCRFSLPGVPTDMRSRRATFSCCSMARPIRWATMCAPPPRWRDDIVAQDQK